MKKLILGILISFNSLAGVTVISDLDDTIKITNAGSIGEASINIFSDKVFTGMPEFLKAARSYSDSLHVVSAGPKLIKKTVERLLRHNNIQAESVNLRNVTKEGKLEFKVRTIIDLMDKSPNEVILLGDDVDLDPEVFDEVKKQRPTRVSAAYIHMVKNRAISAEHIRYWTSLDLALRENMAGRMDSEGVEEVLTSLNNETKLKRVFPKFAHCPKESVIWEWQLSTMFSAEAQELSRKLNGFCGQRVK